MTPPQSNTLMNGSKASKLSRANCDGSFRFFLRFLEDFDSQHYYMFELTYSMVVSSPQKNAEKTSHYDKRSLVLRNGAFFCFLEISNFGSGGGLRAVL